MWVLTEANLINTHNLCLTRTEENYPLIIIKYPPLISVSLLMYMYEFFFQILSMIEEAAGTRLYESKKEAAQRTIEKKDAKLKEIDTVS